MPVAQFSGLASGIDSKALIDAVIQAREVKNQIRQNDIDHLNGENDALEELNTKLLALNDLVDQFRTLNGGGVKKRGSSSDTTVASASVGSTAVNGSYSITVTSTASTAQASFDDTYASLTSALAPNAVGTVNVQVDVGTGSDLVSLVVPITSATTIGSFIDSFNNTTGASGRVTAAAVNVGTSASPSYRVIFNTQQSGLDKGQIAFTIPGSGSFGGQTDLQNRTVSQATNAAFTVSGITSSITRSTNSISDVITGVTLNLLKNGSTTITVAEDADATADLMTQIVDSYNELVEYINENDLVERVENGDSVTNVYGSLAKTRVDNDFLAQFRDQLLLATASSGTNVQTFADLGLETNRDGTLTLRTEDFKTALAADSTGAAELLREFADDTAGVEGLIYGFTKFDGFIDLAITANDDEISNLNDQIEALDRSNAKLRTSLELQFSRLESIVGGLQSQQAALSSVLASL